jgi:CarD family transcriptional regulator
MNGKTRFGMKTSAASTVEARLAKAPPPAASKGKAAGDKSTVKPGVKPSAKLGAKPVATATTKPPPKATAKPAGKPLGKPKAAAAPATAIKPSAEPKIQDAPRPVTNAKPPAPIAAESPPPASVVATPASAAPTSAAPVAAPAPPGNRPHQQARSHGRPMPPPRAAAKEENFVEGDHVVYPTHGVGKVEKINVEDIAGHRLELIHITFEENRMTLRVPVAKARSAGLRKLATRKMFDEALAVLKGRARIKRTMWSRRAQEYEAKINSGDPIAIAEVVRDLHRNAGQPDQSFSERQIYEAAMDRLAAELGALDQSDKATAVTKLAGYLKTIA